MSAIRKLIEAKRQKERFIRDEFDEWKRTSPEADAAEAELNRLIEVQNRDADRKLSLQTQLSELDAAYRAKCLEVSELIGEAIERDRADAELLSAIENRKNGLMHDANVLGAAERWAAAKGGGK